MGVFTRFKDIIGSNINSMLDRAEDPEKMIRMMIGEMEETLVELKANCAGLMAGQKRLLRERDRLAAEVDKWTVRAELAVDKGREDLAREALAEKLAWQRKADGLVEEEERFEALVEQARDDIASLETKLEAARERQRSLVQRHKRASHRLRAREDERRADASDVMMRFDRFEARVERMEAEAEMAGPYRGGSLEDEFSRLEGGDGVEDELQRLKMSRDRSSAGQAPDEKAANEKAADEATGKGSGKGRSGKASASR